MGETFNLMGPGPVAKGEPETAVNPPLPELMVKTETLFDASFAT